MKTTAIQVTQDDILVRPVFRPDGTLEGYFALLASATDGGTVPYSGEIRGTPQEAVEAFAAQKWPELGALAFGRNWIATKAGPGGFKDSDFDCLVAAIGNAFPVLLPDRNYQIAVQCERDWDLKQRQSSHSKAKRVAVRKPYVS